MASVSQKALGSSVEKLRQLGFDPIEAIVSQYNRLCQEIEEQNKIASGAVVRLRADGKPKAYNAEYHMNLIDKAAMMADKLMRYGYGRVLEEKDVVPAQAPVLQINLSDGQQVTLNDDQPSPDPE